MGHGSAATAAPRLVPSVPAAAPEWWPGAKGSMELLADRDPEEARKLLDPVLELARAFGAPAAGTRVEVTGCALSTYKREPDA
jgi:hypothetical protein